MIDSFGLLYWALFTTTKRAVAGGLSGSEVCWQFMHIYSMRKNRRGKQFKGGKS